MRFSILVLTLWVALGRIGPAQESDRVSELVQRVLRASGEAGQTDSEGGETAPAEAEEAPADNRPTMTYYTAWTEDMGHDRPQSWCPPCNQQAVWWGEWLKTHSMDDLPFKVDLQPASQTVPRFEWTNAAGKRYRVTGLTKIDSLIWLWKQTNPTTATTTTTVTTSTCPCAGDSTSPACLCRKAGQTCRCQ